MNMKWLKALVCLSLFAVAGSAPTNAVDAPTVMCHEHHHGFAEKPIPVAKSATGDVLATVG